MTSPSDRLLKILFPLAVCLGLPLVLETYAVDGQRNTALVLELMALMLAGWGLRTRIPERSRFFNSPRDQHLVIEAVVFALLLRALLPADLQALCLPVALLLAVAGRWLTGKMFQTGQFVLVSLLVVLLAWLQNYERVFGRPSFDAYLAIFQTNPAEASTFMADYLDGRVLLYLLGVTLWFLCGRRLLRAAFARTGRRAALALAVVLVTPGVFLVREPLTLRWAAFESSRAQYLHELEQQEQLQQALAGGTLSAPGSAEMSFRGNLIFVLGESTGRRHLQVYGYHRETTPRLAALRDQLLIQRDTIAPHSHTIRAVPAMFRLGAFEEGGAGKPQPGLLNRLRAGGFETWWLSNQSEFGLYDNLVAVMGKTADHARFNRKSFLSTRQGDSYDDRLLGQMAQALAGPGGKKAIFLHLLATHGAYADRVPPGAGGALAADDGSLGAKYFGGAEDRGQLVNDYDNAIRYVDGLLGSIIDTAARLPEPTVVVYLPDHGEDPDAGTGHNSARHSAEHVEIPNIWYLNPPALRQLGAKAENFRRQAGLPFTTSDLSDTLLDLLGATPDTYDVTRSLFSNRYRPGKRQTMCDGSSCIDYDEPGGGGGMEPREIARAALGILRREQPRVYARLWAHRVDSLGKLLSAKQLFAGVELDVVFQPETGRFHVNHPPAADAGLELEDYLQACADRPDLRFWFDWKNAGEVQLSAALGQWRELDRRFAISARSIIETGPEAVSPELAQIAEAGFTHSYYLPRDAVMRCVAAPDGADCASLGKRLASVAARVGASHVSFPFADLPFYERHAGEFRAFKKLTWNLALEPGRAILGEHLADYRDFDVILVTFATPFDI